MEGFMRWTWILLDEMHKPWTCCEMWANFMHDKLLLKVDPLSVIRNRQRVDRARWRTRNITSVTPVSCFSYFAAFRTAQHNINFFFVVSSQKMAAKETRTVCVKEIEGAYLIKNHRNSLLFGFYKFCFRCLELKVSIRPTGFLWFWYHYNILKRIQTKKLNSNAFLPWN